MPLDGTTSVNDIIRGEVEWQNHLLDDFVLLKSDGFPTYHLAVVVDDNLMDISHVLRAEEWLSSTPRHLLIYQALGFTPPKFGHLPMILGPDKSKLSKRHGATSILEYRDEGYLPDALKNFMVLLGWSLDDHSDVIPLETIKNEFSLDRVGKPASIFDIERLQWMNGVYIRDLADENLADLMLPFIVGDTEACIDRDYLLRVVPLIKERMKTLVESKDITSYFFDSDVGCSKIQIIQKGMDSLQTSAALENIISAVKKLDPYVSANIEEVLRAACAESDLKPREFFGLIRSAVTGRDATPPLFELMEVLGKDSTLLRLDKALSLL
jgi:glutamyl-tRNA synthetase